MLKAPSTGGMGELEMFLAGMLVAQDHT